DGTVKDRLEDMMDTGRYFSCEETFSESFANSADRIETLREVKISEPTLMSKTRQ
ncbi:unnamed protein product, partial [Allacma fusca]